MSKNYYFVDYENVHEAGLEGMNLLPRESEVHLFYSQNANKLNLDLLRFVKAKLEVHRVKPGKQSLDMQMVSYLGYCIGEAGREGVFILVSKDTDYANTVLFWREEGVEVRVQPAIREEKNADGMERALRAVKVTRRGRRGGKKTSAAQESAAEPVPAAAAPVLPETAPQPVAEKPSREPAKAAPTGPAEVPKADEKPAAPQPEEAVKEEKKSTRRGRRGGRGRKNQTTENAGGEAPAAAEAAPEEKAPQPEEKPAKPEAKEKAEKPKKTASEEKAVQNTAVPSEPARVTVTVHDVPMVTHAVPEAKPERSQTAGKVQAALADRKVDGTVARKVASIVQKHEGQKNSRQAIYLEIRKTFGQKMGVDLYNSVKGLLK